MKNKFAIVFILTLGLFLLSAPYAAVSHALDPVPVAAEITSFTCDGFIIGVRLSEAPSADVSIDFAFTLQRTDPLGPVVPVSGSLTQTADTQVTSFSWGDFLPIINSYGATYVLPDGTLVPGVFDIPTTSPPSDTAGTVSSSTGSYPLHFSSEPITCEDGTGEGCTPGYWRNHLEDWPPTGYSPGDDFDATFGTDFFDPDITLNQAIWLGGGGLKKVARHGTAGLLSAAHPDVNYPYSVAEVIAFVQAGNIEPVAEANELGCEIP